MSKKQHREPEPFVIDKNPADGGAPLWSDGERGWADAGWLAAKKQAVIDSLTTKKIIQSDTIIPMMAEKGDRVILLEQVQIDGKLSTDVRFINLTCLAEQLGKDVSILTDKEIEKAIQDNQFVYIDKQSYFSPIKEEDEQTSDLLTKN